MSLLDQPGFIGKLRVPRRSVFPPMLMNYASDRGEVTQRLVSYYRRLARGGYGLLITECIFPQFKGGIATRGLALYDDRFMPGFRRLADAVHEEGALLGAQIFFDGAGRTFASEETVSIGPSDLTPWGGPYMREMTATELDTMAEDFAVAAGRAKECGADLIELHMGHAHLLGRFASPYWNRRQDEYGGSRDNRMRFPLQVLRQVRQAVGPDTPVTARLCLTEQIDGGIDLAEAVEIGRYLKEAGIDAVHTSAGTGTSPKGLASIFPTSFSPDAPFAALAREFRRQTGLTTIFAGKVRRHDVAEGLLGDGTADFVSAGRAGLADPDWPKATGGTAPAVPCIGCNQGCTDSLITRKEIVCTVNPALGFEQEFETVRPLPGKARFGVIGAGPAGLTCALGLAERGASVVVYEASDRIGGQYAICEMIPGKELYGTYLAHLRQRLAASSVEVRLGVAAEDARDEIAGLDGLFWAGGAVARRWDGGGLTVPVLQGWEVFGEPERNGGGREVVVVGAGQVGCDAAIWLAERNHRVTLCDRLDDPLASLRARRFDYENALAGRGVRLLFSSDAAAEGQNAVVATPVDGGGEPVVLEADLVVAAVGRVSRPRPGFAARALSIGDAARTGTALEAIRQGTFHAAFASLG